MQTFFPDPDVRETARVLDRRRLGKQRVETMQIMKTFRGESSGWQNHPAVKMWKGFGWALMKYQEAICNRWVTDLGYRDTCLDKTRDIYYTLDSTLRNEGVWPGWIGNEEFHVSHKSNLLRKDPDYYREFWKDTPDDLPYVWPTTPRSASG